MTDTIQEIDFSEKPENQKIVNFDSIPINSRVIVYIRNDTQFYSIVVVTENGDKYTISATTGCMCCEEFGAIYTKLELDDEEYTPHYNCFPTNMDETNLPHNFITTKIKRTKIDLKEIRIYELSLGGCSYIGESDSKLIYEFVLDNGKRYFLGHYNFHNGYYPRDIYITLKEVGKENELQILKTCI